MTGRWSGSPPGENRVGGVHIHIVRTDERNRDLAPEASECGRYFLVPAFSAAARASPPVARDGLHDLILGFFVQPCVHGQADDAIRL